MNTEDSPAIIVDVRTPQEYHGLKGHIKGTKLIPLSELMSNYELLKDYRDREIVVICEAGARSMMAAQLLVRAGFKDVRNLRGGMALWNKKGYPIELN
jgi:rhodanese-related sulfurtransferase